MSYRENNNNNHSNYRFANGIENRDNGIKNRDNDNIGYKANGSDNNKNKPVVTLKDIENIPIAEMLTFSADTLFTLFDKAKEEYDKSNLRRKWLEGVIELKYKTTINSFYKRASDYINNEPSEDMDRYNKDLLIYYIPDIDNRDNMIKVEFYRGLSDIFGNPQIKKRFALVKRNRYGGHNG
ncbi:MAG: hypothetical protein LBG48_03110 [Rickettsiales bacterium]|jgi:hypothetical protein|nr:hypothetical protein [Rickettsiales bacterium]